MLGHLKRFILIWLTYMLLKSILLGMGWTGTIHSNKGSMTEVTEGSEFSTNPRQHPEPLLRNLWTPGEEFELQLWLTSGPHRELLWEETGLVYSSRQESLEFDVPDLPEVFRRRLAGNESVLAEVHLTAPGHPGSLVRFWPLTQYRKLPKPSQRQKLLRLGASSDDGGMDRTEAEGMEGKEEEEEEVWEKERVVHWKPELTIRPVTDFEGYRKGTLPLDLAAFYRLRPPVFYEPLIYFDEFWLLRETFIPVNRTLLQQDSIIIPLPLKISLSPISLWQFRLQLQLERTMRNQAKISSGDVMAAMGESMRPQMATVWDTGIDPSRLPLSTSDTEEEEMMDRQIDTFRAMWLDNNPWFLGLTFTVSLLHSVFDFLAFKNDVTFWKNTENAKGLSVRSIGLNLVSGLIIFLYLLDNDTSWIIIASSGVGVLIETWKLTKCIQITPSREREARLQEFRRHQSSLQTARTEEEETTPGVRDSMNKGQNEVHERNHHPPHHPPPPGGDEGRPTEPSTEASSRRREIAAVGEEGFVILGYRVSAKEGYTDPETNEYDREAVQYLSYALYPILGAYTVYSLLYNEHKGWYSFVLETLVGAVYSFGFILMCPQLWVNYRLKSVAHLPWRMLTYKFLNTIIDDFFAFVIRMPLLHRLSCFRDDIVFLIFLYQKVCRLFFYFSPSS